MSKLKNEFASIKKSGFYLQGKSDVNDGVDVDDAENNRPN